MYLIIVPVIILIAALVVKKILTSEKVDKLAKEFCNLNPKSTESLCNEGDRVLNALVERVVENEEHKELLEEDNEKITNFRSKVKIDVELDDESSETTD